MAQTVKSLLRLSMAMRNLGMLTNYTITKRFIQISTRCAEKETLLSPRHYLLNDDGHDVSRTPMFEYMLRECRLQDQVFNLVSTNQKKMTWHDAVITLHALTHMRTVKGSTNQQIYRKEEFMALCEIVKKNIRMLKLSDIITVLKTFVYFDVPMTSIIAQMILQMVRQSISDLSLNQISFIYFLLQKSKPTPLSEALLMALPIVYENNVATQLDRENIHAIRNALTFLVKKTNKPELFAILMHAIRKCKEPIEPSVALTMLWSLCELQDKPAGLPETVNYLQNILTEGIASLRKREILRLLEVVTKAIQDHPYFYHEGFIDACASVVITEDWGFDDAISILEKLTTLRHTQILLLDYIAGKCFEDPTLLKTCSFNRIVSLIYAFAIADYKPVFWDAIQDTITSSRILNENEEAFLSKLATALLSLDCYCPELLEKVFNKLNENMNKMYMRRTNISRLVLLYQGVKTLYPQYNGPLLDNTFLTKVRPPLTKKSVSYPLLAALECALGGRRYVITNVKSDLAHFIDHVLVMRKGGFPIAINNESDPESDEHTTKYLKDLKPPLESQVILLLAIPAKAYSINTQRMSGMWTMRIKSLEALSSYTVIPIPVHMWTNLSEMEKIPYLMQAIRIKCDEISVSANS